MENYLEKVAKENGNIDVNELSWKQIIALVNLWDTNDAKKRECVIYRDGETMLQASHLERERKYHLSS